MRWVGILMAFGLLGWGWYRVLARRAVAGLDRSERFLLWAVATVCSLSLVSLVLAVAGQFSVLTLLGSAAILSALPALHEKTRGAGGQREAQMPGRPVHPAAVRLAWAAVLVAGATLYLRAGEPVAGNWDPGVYLAQGTALARHGTLRLPDTASPLLTAEEKDHLYPSGHGARVKYPGFYVAGSRAHGLEPQFFPLYPCWVATAALAGSIRPALYLTGLFSLLSLALVMKLGERLGGWTCGMAAGLLFLLNPVQLWFSGFPTAEVLMQALFLAGLWLWVAWLDTGRAGLAWLAGVCMALTMFTSVTGLLLAALAGAAFLFSLRRGPGAAGLLIPMVVLAPLAVIQNLYVTPQYFASVAGYVPALASAIVSPAVILTASGLALAALVFRSRFAAPYVPLAMRCVLPCFVAVACVLVVALGHALWTGAPDADPLRMLSAMVSRGGLLLGAVGLALLVYLRPRVGWPLLWIGVVFTCVFLTSRMMVRLYPWALKRYLPVTLPLVCLCAGYAWSKIAEWARHPMARVLVLVLVLVLGSRLLYRGRAFAFHRDWNGLAAVVAEVDDALPAGAVVFAEKWMATPLEFLHGRVVIPVPALDADRGLMEETASRLARLGHDVYLVEQAGTVGGGEPVYRCELQTSVLEQTRATFGAAPRERVIRLEVRQARGGSRTPSF